MNRTHTIAMWSGPRNLSTAMMRAWENRHDTVVVDEPMYAYYLAQTHRADPMADEIMQTGTTDWQSVVNQLTTPPEHGLQYHKHITTHILPTDTLDWLHQVPGMQHVFLIREPERVVASFNQLLSENAEEDLIDYIGFHQQHRIFKAVCAEQQHTPVVIDSTRFLANPEKQLRELCALLSVPFDSAMLSWPPGLRSSDGLWASHWYASVAKSTGFGQAPTAWPKLTDAQERVASHCREVYDTLLVHAL